MMKLLLVVVILFGIPIYALPVTSGLQVHFDASNINGNSSQPSNGSVVPSWQDLSGNNQNASASSDPVFQSSGAGSNNLAFIDFDGGSDRLDSSFSIGENDITMFVVFRKDAQDTDAGSANRQIVSGSASTQRVSFYTGGGQTGTPDRTVWAYGGVGSSRNEIGFNLSHNDGNFHIFTGIGDQNDAAQGSKTIHSEAFLDGVLQGTSDRTNASIVGGTLQVGGDNTCCSGARHFNGGIAEVIVFDRALVNDELNNVGSFLANKYGINTAFAVVPEPATYIYAIMMLFFCLRKSLFSSL